MGSQRVEVQVNEEPAFVMHEHVGSSIHLHSSMLSRHMHIYIESSSAGRPVHISAGLQDKLASERAASLQAESLKLEVNKDACKFVLSDIRRQRVYPTDVLGQLIICWQEPT